jgi:Leucine-rich repeat (LRR) protein
MSDGRKAFRSEKEKPTPAERRKYRIAAILAVVLVLGLALLLHGGGETRRYERYRRQAAECYQNGDYDQALSELRKAEAIRSSKEVRMLMVDCYEAQGNWDMALETLRQMDRDDEAVTERIAALEQRKLEEQGEGQRIVAGQSYDAATTELDLRGMGLGNGVLQELLQLHALNRLSLADNAITDLEPLAGLGGLRSLDLSGNRVADIGPLAKLSNLRSLNLNGNPVTDLRPLYGLEELVSLSLLGVELPEGQLEELSAALPACVILTDGEQEGVQSLCISGVRFSTDVTELDLSGLGLREIGFLSMCTQLSRLNLTDNEISDLSPLMNLQNLERLRLAGNQIADLRPLMAMSGLRLLDVSRNAVGDTSALGGLEKLQNLDLSDNPVKDFSGLKKLRNLETLRLENTGITDEELPLLYEMNKLNLLTLDRNEGLTAEAMKALRAKMPDCAISHGSLVLVVSLGGEDFRTDITSLYLEGTEISNLFGLEKFDCLETVELGRNSIEDLSAFQNTHSRDSIRYLDLSFNKIRDLSPLASLSALETLDLRYNNISSLGPLMRMNSLKKLDLSGNPLEPEQIAELREYLPDCEIIF